MEPITPEAALELYLEDKQREAAEATVRSHRSRLGHFIDWCDEEGIDNMNDLTARRAHEYRVWRRSSHDRDANSVTMKTAMDTFRVFIRWCESIDAVPNGLAEKILSQASGNTKTNARTCSTRKSATTSSNTSKIRVRHKRTHHPPPNLAVFAQERRYQDTRPR